MVLPLEQARLNAIFRVLCDMAQIDPDALRDDDRGDYDPRYDLPPDTNWEYLRRLWDTALEDETDAPPLPRPTPPPPESKPAAARKADSWNARASDPWTREGGYSDEPPF